MIEITKSGFNLIGHDLDGNLVNKPLKGTAVSALNRLVVLEGDVSLKELLNNVAKDVVLSEFLSLYLCQPQLSEFVDEVNLPPSGDKSMGLDYLEVAKGIDFDEHNFYGVLLDCVGRRKDSDETKEEEGPHFWDMAFIPINEYSHLPIKLAEFVETGPFRTKGDLTLLEFLESVYFMISRHGPPAVRDKQRAGLQDVIDAITEAFLALGGDLAENLDDRCNLGAVADQLNNIPPGKKGVLVSVAPKKRTAKPNKNSVKNAQQLLKNLKKDLKNK